MYGIHYPYDGLLASASDSNRVITSAFANARIVWKETPEYSKADLPGLNKEEVKVKVEGR